MKIGPVDVDIIGLTVVKNKFKKNIKQKLVQNTKWTRRYLLTITALIIIRPTMQQFASTNTSRLAYRRPRRDARLTWPSWLVTARDGIPARRRSPIPVVTCVIWYVNGPSERVFGKSVCQITVFLLYTIHCERAETLRSTLLGPLLPLVYNANKQTSRASGWPQSRTEKSVQFLFS